MTALLALVAAESTEGNQFAPLLSLEEVAHLVQVVQEAVDQVERLYAQALAGRLRALTANAASHLDQTQAKVLPDAGADLVGEVTLRHAESANLTAQNIARDVRDLARKYTKVLGRIAPGSEGGMQP